MPESMAISHSFYHRINLYSNMDTKDMDHIYIYTQSTEEPVPSILWQFFHKVTGINRLLLLL